jgi:hypothetical protein
MQKEVSMTQPTSGQITAAAEAYVRQHFDVQFVRAGEARPVGDDHWYVDVVADADSHGVAVFPDLSCELLEAGVQYLAHLQQYHERQ